jgi:translation initiation factor 2 subunit 3
MPGDETLQKRNEDSDSEEEGEDEDVEEQIPTVEIDISKLHPLSPEVISKQVRDLWVSWRYLQP